jgi:ketosteroid isomerase-like protein
MVAPAFRRATFRVAMAGSLVLAAAATVEAQHLPGDTGDRTLEQQRADFQQEIRAQVTDELQGWANLWERRQAAALAQYYTDAAVVYFSAAPAEGRPAVGDLWRQRLPDLGDLTLEVGELLPGPSLAVVKGRVAYRVTPQEQASSTDEANQFLAVFYRQRDRWLIRAQVFAPDQGHAWTWGDVLRANRRPVQPPQESQVRLVAEAYGGRLAVAASGTASEELVGGALGFEFGRSLEVRGQAWQGTGNGSAGTGAARGYGGEVRVHPVRIWRIRPNLAAGAGRITGTPDRDLIPVVGGGLGFDVTSTLSLQVGARSYLPGTRERVDPRGVTPPRDQRWLFSGGLRIALGGPSEWRDPPLSPMQQAAEAAHVADVQRVMDDWLSALVAADSASLERSYSPAATLYSPGTATYRGPETIRRYWEQARPPNPPDVTVTEVRISGRVAMVMKQLHRAADQGPPEDPLTILTTLEQVNGSWRIWAQAVAGSGVRHQ